MHSTYKAILAMISMGASLALSACGGVAPGTGGSGTPPEEPAGPSLGQQAQLSEGLEDPKGELVWSDEFDNEGTPDPDKWSFTVGNGCPDLCGFGNNERQYYTDRSENVRVEGGRLIIEARNEQMEENEYTSAKLSTEGKGDWQYGYIEVSAKLPRGRGTWPAIWMLPDTGPGFKWPQDGEIDIMEHVGFSQDWIFGTIHTEAYNHLKGTQKSDSARVYAGDEQFYVYGLNWTPEKMEWSINGVVYNTIEKNGDGPDGWPFDKPFHLILNVAVGGDWGGKHGIDDSIWPQRMEVDYVRVYANPVTPSET